MKRIIKSAAVILALFASYPASAVLSVSTVPSSQNVSLGQATTVTLIWSLSTTVSNTFTSTQGLLRASPAGTILGTVSTTISRTIAAGGTAQVSETVLVPADVVLRAHRLGLTSIIYQRQFGDPKSDIPGAITLNITSPLAAGFSITSESLAFDNGAPVRVMGLKQPLAAVAELACSGTGMLQAIWEVAGPASTAGEPFYRPLGQVRQYLASGETVKLKSPTLPTDTAGLYLLRLRITDPVPGFETPVIRYFVGRGRPGKELPPEPLGVVSPAPLAFLASDTAFVWEPVKGAKAYQLEVYATGRHTAGDLPDLGAGEIAPRPEEAARALQAPPVAGVLLPAARTSAVLSAAARRHLEPGQAYLWRVLAIGPDGSVIGVSPPRELRTP